ncbi:MAG TPA: hypothetical protein VGD54_15660 [Steroidobacteraceae bacterium]
MALILRAARTKYAEKCEEVHGFRAALSDIRDVRHQRQIARPHAFGSHGVLIRCNAASEPNDEINDADYLRERVRNCRRRLRLIRTVGHPQHHGNSDRTDPDPDANSDADPDANANADPDANADAGPAPCERGHIGFIRLVERNQSKRRQLAGDGGAHRRIERRSDDRLHDRKRYRDRWN